MENMAFPSWMEAVTWTSVAANLVYVVLAARLDRRCWIWGGVGVALAFGVYVEERLYSDALLQVFYFALAVVGWMTWKPESGEKRKPGRMPVALHGGMMAAGLAGGALLGAFWLRWGADFAMADGMTTSFSMLATWLTARRWLESWLYWIAIDLACIAIYVAKEMWPFAFLFAVYTVLSVWGWASWRRSAAAA